MLLAICEDCRRISAATSGPCGICGGAQQTRPAATQTFGVETPPTMTIRWLDPTDLHMEEQPRAPREEAFGDWLERTSKVLEEAKRRRR
jgi:hypothetical protein